jgi:hypothetical protein
MGTHLKRFRLRRPSPALVISLLALFLALGGTGYAAFKLPKNSVGTKQLRKNAVVSSKVKNHSLVAADFKAGQLPAGPPGPKGDTGATGPAGPTASAYAQNQNAFVYVDSTTTDTVAVQLTAGAGSPLTVTVPSRLHVSGVVRLRNNTGAGNTDQSGCRPQIATNGGTFADVGPQMLGLTNGYNAFNDEATIAVVGELDVPAGTYDARIVCVRTYVIGTAEQNKFNGDAISVIAVAR